MQKRTPRISETEWEIMKLLWGGEHMTAVEVIARLQENDASWHPRTAKTLLNRLVKKRAITFKKLGREYLYRAIVRRETCLEAEAQSFLERIFGGSLMPMVAHFVERRKLSAKEIEQLKAMLESGD